jgi:porphobilinogen synthase
MDPANGRAAHRELALDAAEGADILLVKPAMPQLDLVAAARAAYDLPVAAYQVSGEYAMLSAAAERGWIDWRASVLEALTGIVRAGADIVITYAARDVAAWLREDGR